MRLITLGIAVHFAALSTVASAELPDAELFRRLSAMAGEGSAQAQYNLGMLYNNGIGTAADPYGAFELFEMAAASGDPLASYKVGCYFAGQFPDVVAVDHERALAAKSVAAQSGYSRAQHDVAQLYQSRGDSQEAMKWWAAAAEQGDEEALVSLYSSYRWGLGVPRNDAKALELLLIISRMLPEDRRIKALVSIESLKKAIDPQSAAHAEAAAAAWVPTITPLTIRANMGIREAQQLVQPRE